MLRPQTPAGCDTDDVSVVPGWGAGLNYEASPSMRSSKRKSATAHAPAAKRHMRRQR